MATPEIAAAVKADLSVSESTLLRRGRMQHPGQPVVQNASKQSFAIDGVKLSGCAPGRTRVEHFDPLLTPGRLVFREH